MWLRVAPCGGPFPRGCILWESWWVRPASDQDKSVTCGAPAPAWGCVRPGDVLSPRHGATVVVAVIQAENRASHPGLPRRRPFPNSYGVPLQSCTHQGPGNSSSGYGESGSLRA